jgi:hypothetical protein
MAERPNRRGSNEMTDPTIEPDSAPVTGAAPTERPLPPPAPPTAPPADPSPTPSAWTGKADDDDGDARWAAIIGGVAVLAVGIWFFLDRTLGLDMPDVDWGDIWPIFIIAVGAWLVVRSLARRRT